MTETVCIDLAAHSYDVLIGDDLLPAAGGLISPYAKSGRAFIVTDENLAAAHLPVLSTALAKAGLDTRAIVIEPGEAQKSFVGLAALCNELLSEGLSRKDLIIAFGGGVIGDLAGFAAGILLRGVDFVQIPTTLLAQVDSSVGGKTAIDTAQGKNLVGLFYQPRLVLADTSLLSTLPPREVRAGYAEIVKYGLIDEPDFFAWCETNGQRVLELRADAVARAVAFSVKAKARVVAADERESGARALLNLGHTFGHAIEAAAGMNGSVLHGEAVAAGLDLAFSFSAEQGLCESQDAVRVRNHLEQAGFELSLRRLIGPDIGVDRLLDFMAADKKAEAGRLTFVLTRGIGRAFVAKDVSAEAVSAYLTKRLED